MAYVDPLVEEFNQLKEVILLGGYDHPDGGHAICIYCHKLDDSIEIILANSVQGLEHH